MASGDVVRVGPRPPTKTGAGDDKGSGPKTTAENTAKVARRRNNERAEKNLQPDVPAEHADYLLPVLPVPLDPQIDKLESIGQLIAGVQDFKVLRGSIAVLSLTTSVDYAHLLTDASMISRGNVIVVDIYQVSREYIFGDDDDGN